MTNMDVDGGGESKALFAQVQFYTVLTHDFGEERAEAVNLPLAKVPFSY